MPFTQQVKGYDISIMLYFMLCNKAEPTEELTDNKSIKLSSNHTHTGGRIVFSVS